MKLFVQNDETKYEMDVVNNIALGIVSINGTATTFVPGTKDTEEIPDDQKGGKNNPYTVADALALTITKDAFTDKMVYATGYIVNSPKAPAYSEQYQNWTFYIADTVGGTTSLQCYGTSISSDKGSPYVNDKVTVYGYIKNGGSYGYEFAGEKGRTFPSVVTLERGDATIKSAKSNEHVTITFTPAADSTTGIVSGKNGANVSFTVVCEDGWELNGTPTEAVIVTGADVVYNNGMYFVKLVGDMEVKVSVKVEGSATIEKGTAENPYTAGEAIDISKALTGQASKKTVYDSKATYIKGYVVKITSQTEFEIADSINGKNTITFYQGERDTGVTADVYLNDEVLVYGYIAHYGENYKCEVAGKTDSTDAPTALIKEIKTADVSIAQETSNDYTITFTPANGKNGDKVTFTIEVNDDTKEVDSVTVTNGEVTWNETNQNYEVSLNGNMIVTVALKVKGSKTTSIAFDFSLTAESDSTTALTDTTAKPILGTACGNKGDFTSVSDCTYVYQGTGSGGWNDSNKNVLKLGKSKNGGKITLTFAQNVKKVEINCRNWASNQSNTIKINTSATQVAPQVQTGGVLTFDGLDTASITIETSERVCIFGITVYFE